MNVTFDPQSQLGNASQGVVGLPVIIGLPSPTAPAPSFIIGVTTIEQAQSSNQVSGLPIVDGDLMMKSSRNPGSYTFKLIVSATPNVNNKQVEQIAKVIQQISNIANTLYGGGGVFDALGGVTTSSISSQLSQLRTMKDGKQPIFALNMFMPLSAFSINSPYLTSSWYVERMNFDKQESEQGFVVDITLKELLSKKSAGSSLSILENMANSLLGPSVGTLISSVL